MESPFHGEYFNPRLREGGDIPCDIPCDISTISIHASVREATIFPVCVAIHHWYFNPRLREGGDRQVMSRSVLTDDFNPRLREGGDKHVVALDRL